MKTKTTKRSATRVAALTSAMAILGSGAVLPFADAQTAPDPDKSASVKEGDVKYVVETRRNPDNGEYTAGSKQQFYPGGDQFGWNLVGDACLTPGATGNGNPCKSDVGWNGDGRHGEGWIQLTDASIPTNADGAFGTNTTFKNGQNIGPTSNANQRGSALYNSNIPATRGVEIEFEQVQGGGSTRRMWAWDDSVKNWQYILDPTRGADGIGFYLVDGDKTKNLTKPGTYGAGLGYTQGTSDSGEGAESKIDLGQLKPWSDPSKIYRPEDTTYANKGVVDAVNGVDNGVIGVGIDAFGNFSSKKFGMGYTTNDTYRVPGGIDGYTWEQSALATATDGNGKPACIRDIHPNKNPFRDASLANIGDLMKGFLASDCEAFGMISVKGKSAQFAENLYRDGFDAKPYRTDANGENARFGQYEGISYWEPRTDVLALRGPGNGTEGYQLLATRGSKGNSQDQGEISTAFGIRSFRAQTNNTELTNQIVDLTDKLEKGGLEALGAAGDALKVVSNPDLREINNKAFDVHPSSAYYKYFKVTIGKKKPGESSVPVEVAATNIAPDPNQSVKWNNDRFNAKDAIHLKSTVPASAIPDNYKFGFSASTGAGTDVHAIRDVKIKPLEGGLTLKKEVVSHGGGKTAAKVGDSVKYKFTVTNTGEASLSNVQVTDPIVNEGKPFVCGSGGLEVGKSVTCEGVHKLTDKDISTGANAKFTNATAQGIYDTFVKANPGVDFGKFDPNEIPAEFTSGVLNKKNNTYENTAVATGWNNDSAQSNGGLLYSNLDSADITVGAPPVKPEPNDPKIELTKKVVGKTSGYKEGDTVKYEFVVKNASDEPLTNVEFKDDQATAEDGKAITKCNATELAVGKSTTCTGVHKLKAGEFKDGKFVNTATVTGKGKTSKKSVSAKSTASVTPAKPGDPGIEVTKDIDGKQKPAYKAGEKVPYIFTVENTGAVKLTKVGVTDKKFTDAENKAIKCEATELAPGAKTSCRGTHTLTEEDVATGTFHNVATGTGTPPNGTPITDDDEHEIPTDPERGLKLEKVVNKDSDLAKDKYLAGDKVPYKFTVTNNGKVDLTNVVVEDEALDAPATCEATDLAVGKSTTCEGVHTLTEDEVAQPEFVNIAQAIGEDPNKPEGDPERRVPSNKDEAVVEFPTEALGLVKEVDAKSELAKSVYAAGDKVPYLFTVTNEGNVKIDNIAIEDKALDEPAKCDDASLEAGESTECRGVHTLTEDEAAAGQFRNVATATGTNPNGDPVRSPEDDEIVPTDKNELILDKMVDAESELARESYRAGEQVPYLFNVKNNGPVEIHDLVIVDGAVEGDAICETTTLAPGADTNCRGIHTLTEAEAAKGEFLNVAYASGLDPHGNPVNSNEDQEIVPTVVPRGPLASTGASVFGLAGLALASALVGVGALAIRRRNV